jgi:hypothetical protein
MNKPSHDILNLLDRLKIMHDLILKNNFRNISKEELEEDLKESLKELERQFDLLLNRHR